MKTTIELPDSLLERVKILAVQEHRRFKDLVAEMLEKGLTERPTPVKKPFVPNPIPLRGGHVPTSEEIISIMHEGRA